MIKNIKNLTKIFFKNSFQNPYLIDKKTNKINKKSIFTWMIIILMIAISFISFEIIKYLVSVEQPIIFLNVFFLIFNIIIIFQIILSSINVYFSKKDLDLILPLPIKIEELLIAKFNTILISVYFSELIFALFPLVLYGLLTNAGIFYYVYLLIILLIFPILTNLIISIIMMFLMKFSKFVKNKDIFQVIIILFFIFIIFLFEFEIGNNFINRSSENLNFEKEKIVQIFSNFNNKVEKINNYFLIINPSLNILNNYNKINSIFNLIKIIFINLIFFILFIFIGKKYYLKNILNIKNYLLNKKIDINNLNKKIKKNNIKKSYIKKEFKLLFKNPTFFVQCIFPTIILMFSILIIIISFLPGIKAIVDSEAFIDNVVISVDLSVICLVLGMIQMIFTMSNISITAISREGKDALFMKYIPVDFYKQFKYKTIPQIIINMFLILIILFLLKLIFPVFNFINLLFLFILANLLNIINSNLMLLVDLYRPNLEWKIEYEAVKSDNKIFQYVFTIIIILLLVYFYKIFSDINLNLACLFIIFILILLVFILNKIIKFNINKLFNKIK